MVSDALSDWEAFKDYAEAHFTGSDNQASLEESLSAFRAHQRDLQRLREHLAPSIAEAHRGDARPLDEDALFERIRRAGDRSAS